jgi:cyclophilin family peptidyl-prolyl cis-trans isomerase
MKHKKILIILGMISLLSLCFSSAYAAGKNIVMETSLGKIRIELFDDKAPISAANFRKYVQEKFYDGLIFHRVIPSFVVQGGGFLPGMKPKKPSHPAIKNEADNGLLNKRGTLSMARTQVVDSATSQFFINHVDNPSLDHRTKDVGGYGYAVFGKVTEGMDIVEKIAVSPTISEVPVHDVVMIRVYEE